MGGKKNITSTEKILYCEVIEWWENKLRVKFEQWRDKNNKGTGFKECHKDIWEILKG